MALEVDDARAKSPPIEVLRALAEPLRWRIVELLAVEDLCVCHLVEELAVRQPLASHHLRALRQAGLVDSYRHRYWTYYHLRRDVLETLRHRLGNLAMANAASTGRRRSCG